MRMKNKVSLERLHKLQGIRALSQALNAESFLISASFKEQFMQGDKIRDVLAHKTRKRNEDVADAAMTDA